MVTILPAGLICLVIIIRISLCEVILDEMRSDFWQDKAAAGNGSGFAFCAGKLRSEFHPEPHRCIVAFVFQFGSGDWV